MLGDYDSDGLPDNRQMYYFGNLDYCREDDPDGDGLNPLDEGDAAGDNDNDGYTNRQECEGGPTSIIVRFIEERT